AVVVGIDVGWLLEVAGGIARAAPCGLMLAGAVEDLDGVPLEVCHVDRLPVDRDGAWPNQLFRSEAADVLALVGELQDLALALVDGVDVARAVNGQRAGLVELTGAVAWLPDVAVGLELEFLAAERSVDLEDRDVARPGVEHVDVFVIDRDVDRPGQLAGDRACDVAALVERSEE